MVASSPGLGFFSLSGISNALRRIVRNSELQEVDLLPSDHHREYQVVLKSLESLIAVGIVAGVGGSYWLSDYTGIVVT